jgi:predicted RNA-binding Zn ribbon-like protein
MRRTPHHPASAVSTQKMPRDWIFIGGHPAIDFVNSIECRAQPGETDHVGNYERFLVWMTRASVLSSARVRELRQLAARNPSLAAETWREAARFRVAAHSLLTAKVNGHRLARSDLERVDDVCRRAHCNRALVLAGDQVTWQWAAGDLRQPLWVTAYSTAELLVSPQLQRLRVCANPSCDWLFLDFSRNGQRRWCQMETCGNLSKVRRYRAKHHHGGSGDCR